MSNVGEHLSTLEGAGLIRLAMIEPEVEYAFRHVLVQEAAYESLLKQERRELHARVGEALERLYPDRRDELAGVLALHFEQAELPERAFPYLLEAGEQAYRRFANREAYGFFERAQRVAPSDDSPESRGVRARIGLRMQQAGVNFVPTGEALVALTRVRTDAKAAGDERTLGEALLLTALALIWRGDRAGQSPELDTVLEQATEVGRRIGDEGLSAVPRAFIGQARLGAGELHEATELLALAIPAIEQQGRMREASLFSGELAWGLAQLGEFTDADAWAARSLRLAEASGDPDARLDADLVFGKIEALRGNRAEAIRFAQQAVEQADRVDNKGCGLVGRFLIGEQFLRLGRPSEAISPLTRGGELAEFCALSPAVVARGQAFLASAFLRSGEGARHIDAFDAALEAARSVGDPIAEGEILRERALARLQATDPDLGAAMRDFAAGAAIFERLAARPYLARTLEDQGMALLAAGRAQDGTRRLEQASHLLAEMGLADEAARIRAAAG